MAEICVSVGTEGVEAEGPSTEDPVLVSIANVPTKTSESHRHTANTQLGTIIFFFYNQNNYNSIFWSITCA